MLFTRVTRIALAALLISVALIPLHSATAAIGAGPIYSAAADCDHGVFELRAIIEEPPPNAPELLPVEPDYKMEVWDGDTLLGSTTFVWPLSDLQYFGDVPFDQSPTGDTVLFKLYIWDYLPPPVMPALVADDGAPWLLRGQLEVPVNCGAPIPGCDTQIIMTENAVVGLFVQDAMTSWGPGADKSTTVTITAGNTAWVLGKDATGAYYKIVWGCQYLWVPVSTMGPNPDAVWNSAPLPTTVVE
jgi:hypothetical protein